MNTPGYFESAWQLWYLRQVLGKKKQQNLTASDYLKHLSNWTDAETLCTSLSRSNSAVQQELEKLFKRGLIVRRKVGRRFYYRANDLG